MYSCIVFIFINFLILEAFGVGTRWSHFPLCPRSGHWGCWGQHSCGGTALLHSHEVPAYPHCAIRHLPEPTTALGGEAAESKRFSVVYQWGRVILKYRQIVRWCTSESLCLSGSVSDTQLLLLFPKTQLLRDVLLLSHKPCSKAQSLSLQL